MILDYSYPLSIPFRKGISPSCANYYMYKVVIDCYKVGKNVEYKTDKYTTIVY